MIDSSGLHKAPSKVKAIVEAPSPQNVSQLRSFLGLLTYYAKFVPNLANRLKPLHELLNKSKKWEWTKPCEESFNEVKTALAQSEALTHFNPALPVQLACDASPYGVGAVVSHIMPSGEEKPIAFASRTLSKAECNYAQIEREALAIVFGVKKFHQFLFGRRFTLLTDHRPLTSIFGPHSGILHLLPQECSVGPFFCLCIMISSTEDRNIMLMLTGSPDCHCLLHIQNQQRQKFSTSKR